MVLVGYFYDTSGVPLGYFQVQPSLGSCMHNKCLNNKRIEIKSGSSLVITVMSVYLFSTFSRDTSGGNRTRIFV